MFTRIENYLWDRHSNYMGEELGSTTTREELARLETGYAQSKPPAARVDMPVTRAHDMSETCPVGKLLAEHLLAAAASCGRIRLIIARLGLLGPAAAASTSATAASASLAATAAPASTASTASAASTASPSSTLSAASSATAADSAVAVSSTASAADASALSTAAAAADGRSQLRDWLSLLLCAVRATGASPAGIASGGRSVSANN